MGSQPSKLSLPSLTSLELHKNLDKADRGGLLRRLPAVLWLVLAAAAFNCATLSGCDNANLGSGDFLPTGSVEPVRLKVNVARAAFTESVYEASLSFGTIKPGRSSSLGFSRGGRVAKVLYEVGDFVAAGESIAELEQEDLEKQRAELDQALTDAQTQLDDRARNNPQRVAQVQQEITRLTAQQEQIARELSKGMIVAPYRAQLLERNAEVGDSVPGGRPLFRISADAQPIVECHFPTDEANKTEIGQEFWINKNDQLLLATLASKSPELDRSSRTQRMTLNLPATEDKIQWTYGEVVEVRHWLATKKSGFWLPYSALQREANGLWSAYVIEEDEQKQTLGRRILEVVQLESEHALVQGSLEEGDLYVLDGLNRLVPGQLVVGNLVERQFRQPGPPGTGE